MPPVPYRPREGQYVATAEFYVRYAETDAQGIVHHSSYVLWMEEARLNFARSVGIDYAATEREGRLMSIVELNIHYHAAMRYGDIVRVRCWLDSFKSRSMSFAYHILRAGNIATWPDNWRELMTRGLKADQSDPTLAQSS